MKNMYIGVVLLMLCVVPAYGRIGETKAQCEDRYGKPVVSADESRTAYHKNEFGVFISYNTDGVCDSITYQKWSSLGESIVPSLFPVELSENEIQNFLEANGDKWTVLEMESDPLNKWWKTTEKDDNLIAVYDDLKDMLFIGTISFFERLSKDTKRKEDKSQSGF